jgi:hypothetical protein
LLRRRPLPRSSSSCTTTTVDEYSSTPTQNSWRRALASVSLRFEASPGSRAVEQCVPFRHFPENGARCLSTLYCCPSHVCCRTFGCVAMCFVPLLSVKRRTKLAPPYTAVLLTDTVPLGRRGNSLSSATPWAGTPRVYRGIIGRNVISIY